MVVPSRPAPLRGLDDVPADVARETLRPVCASERWIAGVVDGRPHGDLTALVAASDAALAALDWADVEQALGAHPRIGDRAAGEHREAAWSRQEQSAAAAGEADVLAELKAANVAYERRFGWVFLICAAGRPAEQILVAANARLLNDDETEQDVVRAELRDIVRLRLRKAFAPDDDAAPARVTTSLSTHVLDAVTGRPAAGMAVRLEALTGPGPQPLASRVTDADGRVADLATSLAPGSYRLLFDTGAYAGPDAFYPEVAVAFRVGTGGGHLHVPLLLSPFSYSTYRGS